MVSPGPLVKGHAELATDCFACHAAWRGASSGRCIECHAVADVGLKTTKGVPIASGAIKGSFHQQLMEQDCMACHSDHQGPKLTKRSRKPFSHGLLKEAVRDTCSSCHAAPKDTVHRDLKVECSRCHEQGLKRRFDPAGQAGWIAAGLPQRRPTAASPIRAAASRATRPGLETGDLDHNKYFVLDRDHEATCDTCHKNNDYSRYTCYGCHEHSQAKVRAEHVEEGITDFERCVECHRDPRVEPQKPDRMRERGERRRKDRDKD
jgi:hypothetical protein